MKKGFALIIVLGVLGTLSLIVLFFSSGSSHSRLIAGQYLDQVRAGVLAQSGYEFALSDIRDLSNSHDLSEPIPIGSGTYLLGGDVVSLTISDLNGRIHINDGIRAGEAELSQGYIGNQLNPWPDSDVGIDEPVFISGWVNQRLRRLLNAYGDVHRFLDKVYEGNYQNCSDPNYYGSLNHPLPNPPFSTRKPPFYSSYGQSGSATGVKFSPDGPPGYKDSFPFSWPAKEETGSLNELEYNNGLGDRILEARVKRFESLNEIRKIVNDWAASPGIELSEEYLQGKSFYELIKPDLTVVAYEDDQIWRLIQEFDGMEYVYAPASTEDHGTAKSRPLNKYQGSAWPHFEQHAVSLINLGNARFPVRAATFYAPTHVRYFFETAHSIFPYGDEQNAGSSGGDSVFFYSSDDLGAKLFTKGETAYESIVGAPEVGVSPPVFKYDADAMENGFFIKSLNSDSNGPGRKSHLMSLRDAMHLANQYEIYEKDEKKILNFDDFRGFLEWHESQSQPGLPSFERVHSFKSFNNYEDGKVLDKEDFNAGGLFHICEFSDNSLRPAHSEFFEDYISATLPHIMSCVRRVPSFLVSPSALQSPYIVMKPGVQGSSVTNGISRKVEDFVQNILHPKVCFLDCGYFQIEVVGQLHGASGVIAESRQEISFKLFETKYYRSQKSFESLTDNKHEDIKIGPEDPDSEANEILGVVGLEDFKRDVLNHDLVVGYMPQVVMNFDAEGSDSFKNIASDDFQPMGFSKLDPEENENEEEDQEDQEDPQGGQQGQQEEVEPDLWEDEIDMSLPEGNITIEKVRSQGTLFIGDWDLSSFNGVAFRDTGYNYYYLPNQVLNKALYWRLDDWLDPDHTGAVTEPAGKMLSAGAVTFWCQLPAAHDYAGPLHFQPTVISPLQYLFPKSLSRVLMSLNMWEAFETIDSNNPKMTRPVALTIGLKKTEARGLNIFARYDTGGPSPIPSKPSHPYSGPVGFDDLPVSSELDAPQYDYLGFLCLSSETLTDNEDNDYAAYRSGAYRSSEVSVKFKSVKEAGPGTWHRVSVIWDFGVSKFPIDPKKQLAIHLHNRSLQDGPPVVRESYIAGDYPEGVGPEQDPLKLLEPGSATENLHYPGGEGGMGFMLPFDVGMTLSFGYAHFLKLGGKTGLFGQPGNNNKYKPYWRFNSAIDNIRLRIGRSDPELSPAEFQVYLDPDNREEIYLNTDKSLLGSMRYNVTRYPWHSQNGLPSDFYQEPDWVIDPGLPEAARVIALGARIYYPPDSDENSPNTPYVRLSSYNDKGEIRPFDRLSANEQDIFYPDAVSDDSYRVKFQYMYHKPLLDGDQETIGDALDYGANGRYFTNIPWIEEFSVRYIPKGSPVGSFIELD